MDERLDAKDTIRTEGFSDGVFAIAVTLLVLDLTVPRLEGATPAELLAALRAEIYPLAVLMLSFGTIFIMWVNHHRFFLRVHHLDNRIMLSNGLLLFLVTVCPFPTALAAEYLGQPTGNIAAGVYAGYFVIVNIAFNLLIESAARGQHAAKHGLDEAVIRRVRRALRLGFVAYVAAFIAAFWSAWLSLGICAVLWCFWTADMFRPVRAFPTPGRS
jgi:TMEM175 potassium channel family protein